jgi:hypothetical protein
VTEALEALAEEDAECLRKTLETDGKGTVTAADGTKFTGKFTMHLVNSLYVESASCQQQQVISCASLRVVLCAVFVDLLGYMGSCSPLSAANEELHTQAHTAMPSTSQ